MFLDENVCIGFLSSKDGGGGAGGGGGGFLNLSIRIDVYSPTNQLFYLSIGA